MKPLPPGRARCLEAIVSLTARGESITFRSIALEAGLSSTSTVKAHVDRLIRGGRLVRATYLVVEVPDEN